jgi:hydrogenase expression/formation protein HypD
MKYLAEYRDAGKVRRLLDEIDRGVTRPWVIMEICGGQTHSIIRHGLDRLLNPLIELVHGPGCPVCVTPLELIDKALLIAARPDVIFTSFGDMLRVPGSHADLFHVKSAGADVRVIYSPLDCLKLARDNPDKQVVFFGVGFETTAPANAMAVLQAHQQDIPNFSMLVSHVRVPPAIQALLNAPENRVQGFLAAGHVCTVMGTWEYEPLVKQFGIPIVVTGFEPVDLARGILHAVRQLEQGQASVENAYERLVVREGNRPAQQVINAVFEVCDRKWRGVGLIPDSGWKLREQYARYDAEKRFDVGEVTVQESPLCQAGLVLQGRLKPSDCPAFGRECTPRTPLGAPMVSGEGACAAYYQFGRINDRNTK